MAKAENKMLEEAIVRALSRGVDREETLYVLAFSVGLPVVERVAIFDRVLPIGVFSEAIH